jgi:hypothetical protein
MDKIVFGYYFLKLRLDVLIGRHKTTHPLDIKWRWKHWLRLQKCQSIGLFSGTKMSRRR